MSALRIVEKLEPKDWLVVIAAATSIANLITGLYAAFRSESRKSHREMLAPLSIELGELLHELVATSTVCLKRIANGQSIEKWHDRSTTVAENLKAVRRKVKYPLWGIDHALNVLGRLPSWLGHCRERQDQANRLVKAAEALRLAIDKAIVASLSAAGCRRDQARKVYQSLASLPVGEGWIWAPDQDLLKHVRFPAIQTLDTSKTPQAGEARVNAPVLASADLAKITRQIEAIQAAQDGKRPRKASATKPRLVPPLPIETAHTSKDVTATSLSQLGAAILAVRKEAGLSQAELAARLNPPQPNVARLESGRSNPSTTTLHRIAKATGHKLVVTFARRGGPG